ncbi:aldolase [Actinomycetospora sp. NBRC 106375]|uniref:HpcH/HpaI aldolase family protein n=1 Tax=Actinomycetospora sp. NBRC 106375 TaxID=3032207 RepID=UPI0024A3EE60|nr:aldolase/citrate lyase family protein [Actinomycetospora sp. NBRC 106375]GLZ50379.1 aldolase [Actinomycetospora sp. NBRC 106375]
MGSLKSNTIGEALEEGRFVLGTWVQMNSPETCQIAGLAGYDFVIIDMEHGALSISDVASLVRAARSVDIDAIVRVPDSASTEIRRALDAGARGILVPGISTAEQARAAVAATIHQPDGTRGACPCVPSMDFGTVPWPARRFGAPDPLTWLLIENVKAVSDIDAIVAEGPDAVVLGPFDLSMSMGLNGEYTHSAVNDALSMVVEAARRADVDAVYVAVDQAPQANADGVLRARRAGCRLATTFIDRTLLAHTYRGTVGAIHESLRQLPPED